MRPEAPLAATMAVLVVAGCAQSAARRRLDLSGAPLVAGARVVAQARSCDRGAKAYCSLQVVVVAPRFHGSMDLLVAEEHRLRGLGWTSTAGDTPKERSADSPGHRLRLSLGMASDDLLSWDQGQIKRRRPIARALARAMFERAPALSLMLQTGSS